MRGKVVAFSKYDPAAERKGIKLEVNGQEVWFSWFGSAEKSNELFGKIEKGNLVEFDADKTKIVSFKKLVETREQPTTIQPQKPWGKSEEETERIARMNALTNATGLVQTILPLFPPNSTPPTPNDVLKIAEQYANWILKKNGEEKK